MRLGLSFCHAALTVSRASEWVWVGLNIMTVTVTVTCDCVNVAATG
jgi:hypothetical protein